MFSQTLILSVLAAAASVRAVTLFNPGSLKQCHKADIKYYGDGQGKYKLNVYPSCDAVEDVDNDEPWFSFDLDDKYNEAKWTVNINAGLTVQLSLTDPDGNEQFLDGDFTVEDSDDKDCLSAKGTTVVYPAELLAEAAASSSSAAAATSATTSVAASPALGTGSVYVAPKPSSTNKAIGNVAPTQSSATSNTGPSTGGAATKMSVSALAFFGSVVVGLLSL